ncbi:MAG TPA: hypothetical protein VN154_09925, partial [Rhizomicrobium sp.]|nr:hypothetical protein [Rhizomicrobium sp.]
MRFSPAPDLSSPRRIGIVAILLWLVQCVSLVTRYGIDLRHNLGDTDDAMRLVMVRHLLASRAWFQQLVTRLDPPNGVYLHWSRLLDGGLACTIWLVERICSPTEAELIVRIAWPLAWIFPAVISALFLARNIGARSAVFLAAIILVIEAQPYRQFIPGRIDHHGIQITFAMAALATATLRTLTPRAAAAIAAFSGLGLAIGLEALPLHALIGASVVFRFLQEPRHEAKMLRAYGLALALAAPVLFVAQTPAWRWSISLCDALAFNLVAMLVVAGLGFAAVSMLASRLSRRSIAVAAGLVACAATVCYLALDPRCIHGPFAEVAPRVHSLWLDRVQELEPWPVSLTQDPEFAIHAMTTIVMAGAGAVFLWWRRRENVPEILALATFIVASAVALRAQRGEDYVFWVGLPVLAAALSIVSETWLTNRMLPMAALASVLVPVVVASFLQVPFAHAQSTQRSKALVKALCNDPSL